LTDIDAKDQKRKPKGAPARETGLGDIVQQDYNEKSKAYPSIFGSFEELPPSTPADAKQ
jgi:hypothetical protein